MSIGTVKWYNAKKGYGFIIPELGGRDVFVHISQLQKAGIHQLKDGQRIKYDLYADNIGRAAAGNLKLI
ncbi:MAG: cold-shock protein [Alphaproteobacteria bacterium]|nr:cold-shock protein [Alphaproteobacteria bacterium]